MKISFLDVAQQELDEAINYFNDEVPNLGSEFLGEVLKALDNWQPSPCLASLFSENQALAITTFSIWRDLLDIRK